MKTRIFLLAGILFFCTCACSEKTNQVSYQLLPVAIDNEKWGYIDHEGKYAINPQFAWAGFFVDGLACVSTLETGKFGYINKNGDFVIDANYKHATCFSEGFAMVTPENGFPACIDKKGKIQFELKEADALWCFSEGLACVLVEGRCGYVNYQGEIVITPQFDVAGNFCEGLAIVQQDGKFGYIGKDGLFVINPQFQKAFDFSEGLALINDGKKWGYIDKTGLYVINPQFDDARSFNEGLAVVGQKKMYGFINKQGKIVINPQFDDARSFNEGLAVVGQKKMYGFIDKQGKIVINPQFKSTTGFFTKNMAGVLGNNDQWGFINRNGQYIINPQFKIVGTSAVQDYPRATNDYYDASVTAKALFEHAEGSDFGSTRPSTLSDLLKKYNSQNLRAESSQIVVLEKKVKLDENVSCTKRYKFRTAIQNSTFWLYRNSYDLSARVSSVIYQLNLSGKAAGKDTMLIDALKTELEQKYSETIDENNDVFTLNKQGNHPKFILSSAGKGVKVQVIF
jgi:hypothetical protein